MTRYQSCKVVLVLMTCIDKQDNTRLPMVVIQGSAHLWAGQLRSPKEDGKL